MAKGSEEQTPASEVPVEKLVKKLAEPVHEANGEQSQKFMRALVVAGSILVFFLILLAYGIIDSRFQDHHQTGAIKDLAASNKALSSTARRQAKALEALKSLQTEQTEFISLFRQLIIAFASGDVAAQRRVAAELQAQQDEAEANRRAQGRGASSSGGATITPGPTGPQGPPGRTGDPGRGGGGTTSTTTTTTTTRQGPVGQACDELGVTVTIVCEEET